MSLHRVEEFKDVAGNWRWRVIVSGTEGSAVEDSIVADSGQGYANKKDMQMSFLGQFFGEWDESFLALYNDFSPDDAGVQTNGASAQPTEV